MVVVFPDPLDPRKPKTSPRRTSNDKSWITVLFPKSILKFLVVPSGASVMDTLHQIPLRFSTSPLHIRPIPGACPSRYDLVMPKNKFPPQRQKPPGIESKMVPKPQYIRDDYRGSGKLTG